MTACASLFADGGAYERLMGRWSQPAGRKFLDWIDPPKHLRWIDVGCGNGAFTEVLIAHCAPAAVTGVDPSEGQLDYARKRPGVRLAQFRTADAQHLPFADDSFDAASMALVITFVPDPLKAAQEMARVVRSGGTVASYMWDFEGGGFPLRFMGRALEELRVPLAERPSTEASRRDVMQSLWQKAGLTSVETTVLRSEVAYANFDDFWESNGAPVGTTGNAIAGMTPDERDRLREHLRARLPVQPDGRIVYEAFANAVKGKVA